MAATGTEQVTASATGSTGAKVPGAAQRLRLPLHARSQERMTARWGFDLNARDAPGRAEALLAETPADADRLLLVAALRSSRGDDAGALVAAQQAVQVHPASAGAHSTLAALLARTGDTAAAARHAEAAVGIDPQDPSALYNRGLINWTLGDRRAARGDFDRAATLLGIGTVPWWRRRRQTG
jgi:Flp pilus assembly protein TadD